MKGDRMSDLNLKQMEELLSPLLASVELTPPRGGWIKGIRTSLGMLTRQLAARLGLTPSAVSQMEDREVSGSITLAALEKAARAMNCNLVYALVPRAPLSAIRKRQALATASEILGRVSHTMGLEAQTVASEKTDRMTHELAEELLRTWSSRIWEAKAP